MHKGSKTGGYAPPGAFYTPQPQDNSRHYTRGEAQYHSGGGGAGGGVGGMRNMHHHSGAPPTQPPTPPNVVGQQEMKQQPPPQPQPPPPQQPPQQQQAPPPPHMQQPPPQAAQQVMGATSVMYNVRGANPNFIPGPRQQPPNQTRMPAPSRQVILNANGTQYIPNLQVYQPVVQGPTMYLPNQLSRNYAAIYAQPGMMPSAPQPVYGYSQFIYATPQVRPQGGPSGVPQPPSITPGNAIPAGLPLQGTSGPPIPPMISSQATVAQQQSQSGLPGGPMPQSMPPIQQHQSKRKRSHALCIIDPNTQKEIDLYDDGGTEGRGGSQGDNTDGGGAASASQQTGGESSAIAVEFARKVASTLVNETSPSPAPTPPTHPTPPASNSSRRNSATYHAAVESVSAPPSAPEEGLPSEAGMDQMEAAAAAAAVYGGEVIAPARWPATGHQPGGIMPVAVDLIGPPMTMPMMVMHAHGPGGQEEILRQNIVGGWVQDGMGPSPQQHLSMTVPMGTLQSQQIPMSPTAAQQQQQGKPSAKANETPVVSANTNSPPVDIGRNFPIFANQRHAASHQSPGRVKRKPQQTPSAVPMAAAAFKSETPETEPSATESEMTAAAAASIAEDATSGVPENVYVSSDAKSSKSKNKRQQSKHYHGQQQQNPSQQQSQPQAPQSTPENDRNNPRQQTTPPLPSTNGDASCIDVTGNVAPAEVEVSSAEATSSSMTPALAQANVGPSKIAAEVFNKVELQMATMAKESLPPVSNDGYVNHDNKEKDDSSSENSKEESIVAAMNEENAKLSQLDNNNVHNTNNNISNNNNNNIDGDTVKVIVESAETAKPSSKLVYKEDQWSPQNRDGKKRYDRDFILELLNDPQSQRKPENFPNTPLAELLKDGRQQRNPLQSIFTNSGNMGGAGGMMGLGSMGPSPFMGGGGGFMGRQDVLMPYFNKSSSQRGLPASGKRGSSQSKPKPTKPAPIQVSLSLSEEVKLRAAENPWKPARIVDTSNMTEDEKKTDLLYKKVRSILNKLTPQKFETLVDQVTKLNIDTHARLRGVIDLVFEKAVDEPNFSKAYAALCKKVTQMAVEDDEAPMPEDSSQGRPKVNFRKLLVLRCQKQFEKDSNVELNREERQRDIDAQAEPEKKKIMIFQLEEDERKIRVRSVGNIRFIGELYKLGMLNTSIMFSCISRLLDMCSEESLECLCKLLTTIGKGLEDEIRKSPISPPQQQRIDELKRSFERLNNIAWQKDSQSNAKNISNRVRFMIRDLIDLRENNYTPRRDDSNPKTIEQIQREAEREQLETSMALNAMEANKRLNSLMSGNASSSMPAGIRGVNVPAAVAGMRHGDAISAKRSDNADSGWTTVGPAKGKGVIVNSAKLKLDPTDVTLGTFGSRSAYQWSNNTGSSSSKSGGGASAMASGASSNNKFACLSSDMEQRRPSSRNSSFKGISHPPGFAADANSASGASSFNYNHEDGALPRGSGSRPHSRDITPPSTRQNTPAPAPVPKPAQAAAMDPETLEKDVKAMCEEYLSARSVEEACLCLEKLPADLYDEVMCQVFTFVFDQAEAVHGEFSRMLVGFLNNGAISRTTFLKGFTKTIQMCPDLSIDIPRVWQYVGQLCAETVFSGALSMHNLVDELIHVVTGRNEDDPDMEPVTDVNALQVIGALCACASTQTAQRRGSLAASASTWVPNVIEELCGGDQERWKQFVQRNKLDWLESGEASALINNSRAQVDDNDDSKKMMAIQEQLVDRFKRRDDFDTISQWIDETVVKDQLQKSHAFVRTLTTAVLNVALTKQKETWQVDQDIFRRHANHLIKFINHGPDLELHCLFAVQAMLAEMQFPKGVLSDLCQLMHDRGVVSTETFRTWRDSNDARALNQKGVCMMQLTTFYTMLEEADTDEDEGNC